MSKLYLVKHADGSYIFTTMKKLKEFMATSEHYAENYTLKEILKELKENGFWLSGDCDEIEIITPNQY